MNGITMARKIKERGIISQMIFLTNLKDVDHVSQAMDVSAIADYIVKADTSIDKVVARIKEKLEYKKA